MYRHRDVNHIRCDVFTPGIENTLAEIKNPIQRLREQQSRDYNNRRDRDQYYYDRSRDNRSGDFEDLFSPLDLADLFAPLHFKATKSLRQSVNVTSKFVNSNFDKGRFVNRKQINNFNEEYVHKCNKQKYRRDRNFGSQALAHEERWYDDYIKRSQVEDSRSVFLTFKLDIIELMERKTHAGDIPNTLINRHLRGSLEHQILFDDLVRRVRKAKKRTHGDDLVFEDESTPTVKQDSGVSSAKRPRLNVTDSSVEIERPVSIGLPICGDISETLIEHFNPISNFRDSGSLPLLNKDYCGLCEVELFGLEQAREHRVSLSHLEILNSAIVDGMNIDTLLEKSCPESSELFNVMMNKESQRCCVCERGFEDKGLLTVHYASVHPVQFVMSKHHKQFMHIQSGEENCEEGEKSPERGEKPPERGEGTSEVSREVVPISSASPSFLVKF